MSISAVKLRNSIPRLLAVCLLAMPFDISNAIVAVRNNSTVAEQYLLSAANQERAARGLQALEHDPQLALAASAHARAMADHGTISHQFDGEPDLTRRGAAAGVPFSLISENVGEAPDVVMIHDMWMHSEHHRSNLLDPAIDSAGISVVERDGEYYAVEDFARVVRKLTLKDQETAISGVIAHAGQIQIAQSEDAVTAARQTCSTAGGYAGDRRPAFIMRFTSDSLTKLPDELASRLASGRYHDAAVGACRPAQTGSFTGYSFAVLLYR